MDDICKVVVKNGKHLLEFNGDVLPFQIDTKVEQTVKMDGYKCKVTVTFLANLVDTV